ncbi:hypothetical protein JCM10908_004836 [Rhodotorula pacifica]|uniref:uncharacterized protein n=1 Tax=Rhodotorula pacifica TaxID=1495444 RepID=UPI00316FBDEB
MLLLPATLVLGTRTAGYSASSPRRFDRNVNLSFELPAHRQCGSESLAVNTTRQAAQTAYQLPDSNRTELAFWNLDKISADSKRARPLKLLGFGIPKLIRDLQYTSPFSSSCFLSVPATAAFRVRYHASRLVCHTDRSLGAQSLLSSRFSHIVSSNNLANSFMSFSTSYSDTGLFGIYMVSENLTNLDDLTHFLFKGWQRLATHPCDGEVTRAKCHSGIVTSLTVFLLSRIHKCSWLGNMPRAPSSPTDSRSSARSSASPYPAASFRSPSPSSSPPYTATDPSSPEAEQPSPARNTASTGQVKSRAKKGNGATRHLSCENCRLRKIKCSRQSPCLTCKMRGDTCKWVGSPPAGGSNDVDALAESNDEIKRLRRLVDALLERLEEQEVGMVALEGHGLKSPSAEYQQHFATAQDAPASPPPQESDALVPSPLLSSLPSPPPHRLPTLAPRPPVMPYETQYRSKSASCGPKIVTARTSIHRLQNGAAVADAAEGALQSAKPAYSCVRGSSAMEE